MSANELIKIVITGAESSGKSTLTEGLAKHFKGISIPEFARSYVEEINRPYIYADVEAIARMQIEAEKKLANSALVFFDTWLIITKVWFDFVYDHHPEWLEAAIGESEISLFLLCDIDIPWMPDSVRENGGENRKILHKRYLEELKKYNFNFQIVQGKGEERLNNAIGLVNDFLKKRQADVRPHNTYTPK